MKLSHTTNAPDNNSTIEKPSQWGLSSLRSAMRKLILPVAAITTLLAAVSCSKKELSPDNVCRTNLVKYLEEKTEHGRVIDQEGPLTSSNVAPDGRPYEYTMTYFIDENEDGTADTRLTIDGITGKQDIQDIGYHGPPKRRYSNVP